MLKSEGPLFNAMFNMDIPRIILLADAPKFTILEYNQAYDKATHLNGRNVKGLFLFDAFEPGENGVEGSKLLAQALGSAIGSSEIVITPIFNYEIPLGDGSVAGFWKLEIIPIADANGQTEYLLVNSYNVTEELAQEENLRKSLIREQRLIEELEVLNEELMASNEELVTTNEQLIISREDLEVANNELEETVNERTRELELAVEAGSIGLWNIDVDSGRLWNSPMVNKLFGIPVDKKITYANVISLIDDEFKESVKAAISFAINNKTNYDFTYSQKRQDNGKIIWIRSFARLIENPQTGEKLFSGVIQDVTGDVEAQAEIKARKERIDAMVANTPIGMAILKGSNFVIEVANKQMFELWNRDQEVIGMEIIKAFPELIDQPFPEMLKSVYDTGNSISLPGVPVSIHSKGITNHLYVDFSYNPLFENGEVESILVTVRDVSNVVKSHLELEQTQQDLQSLNEELTVVNEELHQTQEQLYTHLEAVANSESRLRFLLEDAPVAIAVMKGRSLIVEAANKMVLQIWGKTTEIIGKPLHEALPELNGQEFLQWLDDVYTKGIPFVGNEVMALLEQNGELEEVYSNFVYHPIKNQKGEVDTIMLVATVITEEVKARKKMEQTREQFVHAVQSADMGAWSVDPDRQKLMLSDRSKEIFGINLEEQPTFERVLAAVPDEYHELIHKTVTLGLSAFEPCDLEYPVNNLKSGERIWIRITGKMFFDSNHKPLQYSGMIMDITDRKMEEQRKDDFISIASHELKTPVTSLKASLQFLSRLKDRTDTELFAKLVDQANNSVEKITTLIEDLLNTGKINEGQLELSKSLFNVSEMLNRCCSHVRLTGQHELIFKGDRELTICADEHRIDQVIVNLVNNAVKYASESKEIHLIAEQIGDMAKISVKDFGAGIAADKVPFLFSRYFRADYKGSQTSGLGLGLYISSEIVKRHNGKIGVETEIGQGSTFWFLVPIN